jgi:hypothetical protein
LQELQPSLKELFSDVFGNYVIQKLLDYGGEEDKKTISTQVPESQLPYNHPLHPMINLTSSPRDTPPNPQLNSPTELNSSSYADLQHSKIYFIFQLNYIYLAKINSIHLS